MFLQPPQPRPLRWAQRAGASAAGSCSPAGQSAAVWRSSPSPDSSAESRSLPRWWRGRRQSTEDVSSLMSSENKTESKGEETSGKWRAEKRIDVRNYNSVNNSHFNLKLLLIHVFKLNTQTSLPHPNTPSPYNIMQCNNSARHARFVRFIMETVRFNLTVRSKEAKEKRKGKTNLTFAGSSCLNVRICWFSLSNMMVRGKSLGFLCIFLIFDIWQTKW